MKSFIKILIASTAIALCSNLTASSQTITLSNEDTLICFTKLQSKWLLKQVYNVDELTVLDSLSRAEIALKDSIISINEINEIAYKHVIANNKTIVKGHEQTISDLKKEVKRQKVLKYVGFGGIILVILLSI